MANLNKVMLMGNLTRDPELRYTPKGTAVTEVSMAINRYYSRDDGQRGDDTTFVEITLWGRLAEVVCQYCHKGRPLFVEGRLNLDTWQDKKTGENRSKLRVVGENIQLIGGRDGGGGQQSGGNYQPNGGYNPPPQSTSPLQQSYQPPPQQQQQQRPSPPPQVAPTDEDEDIPF